ncbi:MAG: XRE family transcriptional regulator [Anaerolineaceae bacterium]|nr:XRE family transcriptional regulator [Anaerolineaceae bacterium]
MNPELLVWGRETIGYDLDEAASKLGIDAERLTEWETGKSRPTVVQLFRIASAYKRPFAAFYFFTPPTQWDETLSDISDWRTLPEANSRELSPELVTELRESVRRRDILLDLAEEMNEQIPTLQIPKPATLTTASARSLATQVRDQLGVSVGDQKRFRDVHFGLRIWRNSVEQLGILVSQTGLNSRAPVKLEEMRGVAIWAEPLPIILLNGKDHPNARIFTLMHELGHLILRQKSIINSSQYIESAKCEEIFCNELAGELLVPSNTLLSDPLVVGQRHVDWSEETLEELAESFCVSKEVILRRLLANKRTSQAIYQKKRSLWRQEWRKQEETSEKPSFPQRHHIRVFNRHGMRFVSTVLEAYGQGAINASQLSEYIGAKLKHINNLRSYTARALT